MTGNYYRHRLKVLLQSMYFSFENLSSLNIIAHWHNLLFTQIYSNLHITEAYTRGAMASKGTLQILQVQ